MQTPQVSLPGLEADAVCRSTVPDATGRREWQWRLESEAGEQAHQPPSGPLHRRRLPV